ncbi:MAG: dockerin type I repeat-containing protein [Chloroflexi bacterium]|nr:dockerin type I repeat-containing protein [Chloroflexota bacterium]
MPVVTSELVTATPEAPLPTVPILEASPVPAATSQIFPTLDLTAAVSADLSLVGLLARGDIGDGRTTWEHTAAWSPQPSDAGVAWQLSGSGTEQILHWLSWIDLRTASASVMMSFETQFSGTGTAQIELSPDGVNWLMLAVVPVSPTWTTLTVDLSAFRGSVIQLRFAWYSVEATDTVDWWLRAIHVDEIASPLLDAAGIPPASAVENLELTNVETVSPPMVVFPCQLDVDADGVITEADFTLIADLAFSGRELQSADFDLNGNQQIDIGDLQLMAQYRLSLCAH